MTSEDYYQEMIDGVNSDCGQSKDHPVKKPLELTRQELEYFDPLVREAAYIMLLEKRAVLKD